MLTGRALIDDIQQCRVPAGSAAFWWLGQHGFIVKLGATVCYIDAYLSPSSHRQVPPLLDPAEAVNASVFLGTHDHSDHIDRPVWPALAAASPNARFVVPKLLRAKIVAELGLADDRVLGIDQGVEIEAGDVRITAIPAAHEFLDSDAATGLHPYVGFIIEGPGFRLYHAGDTCLYEGIHANLRGRGPAAPLDLAFLPINGRDAKRFAGGCIGNMTYQEAADLAGSVQPGLTVPTHFEMFAMNSENPQLFLDYMRVKYPTLKTHIPQHGERVVVTTAQK